MDKRVSAASDTLSTSWDVDLAADEQDDDVPQEHWKWLAHEAFQKTPVEDRPIPSELDVLCGRGGLTNYHPGNVAFRSRGAFLRPAYMKLPEEPKRLKTRLAFELIQWVFYRGGRFLTRRRSDQAWSIASWGQIQKKGQPNLAHRLVRTNSDHGNGWTRKEYYKAQCGSISYYRKQSRTFIGCVWE